MALTTIGGTSGNDKKIGTNANELFFGLAGNDDFDGGAGTDTAGFNDVHADFTISTANGVTHVKHRDNKETTWDGNDKYTNVERLHFADQTVFLKENIGPAAPGTHTNQIAEDAPVNKVTGDVLSTTEDSEGDDLAVNNVGTHKLQYGTLVMRADGTYEYSVDNANAAVDALNVGSTPLVDFFSFTVSDFGFEGRKYGTSVAGTLNITINGANDAASITGAKTGSVTEDGTLTASGKLAVTDVDSLATFQAVAAADLAKTYGSFTFNTDGTWGYTLNNSAKIVQDLNTGQTVNDTLTVKSLDGTAQETISVAITGVNDAVSVTTSLQATRIGYTHDYSYKEVYTFANNLGATSTQTYTNGDGEFARDGQANFFASYTPAEWNYLIQQADKATFVNQATYTYLASTNPSDVGYSYVNTWQGGWSSDLQGAAEYAVSAIDGDVTGAKLKFALVGNNGDATLNSFEYRLYAADGQITLSDYNKGTGTVVKASAATNLGGGQWSLDLDVALVNQLISQGATHVGINARTVEPNNGYHDYSSQSDQTYTNNWEGYSTTIRQQQDYTRQGDFAYLQVHNPILELTYMDVL